MSTTPSTPNEAAREAHDSTSLDYAVRVGLVAYGVVHLLIGWLAVQLALGNSDDSASSDGALHQLAEQPFGRVLVWLVAVGLVMLVIWRVLEALYDQRGKDDADAWKGRASSAAKALIYAVLAWSGIKTALGDGSSGGTDSTTAKVMDLPAGQWLVAAAGLAVIGYGAALVHRGWTEKFREHLEAQGQSGADGSAYVLLGKVGYVAKGVAIAVVGGLFVYAGVTHEAKKSGGLDQALVRVRDAPFGPVLLIAVALGIAAYGLFCFARARHLDR